MPYIRSKLHSIYNREREARLQASLWAHDDTRLGDTDYLLDRREISPVSDGDMVVEESSLMQAKRKIMAVIGACYPSIHATNEGI